MSRNPTHLSDCAVAFEAAVRELSRRYPPCKVPKEYPVGTATPRTYTIWEEDMHRDMIFHAGYGRIQQVRSLQYRSGIPKGELEAVIALIYG